MLSNSPEKLIEFRKAAIVTITFDCEEYKLGPAKRKDRWGEVWEGPELRVSMSSGCITLSAPTKKLT